ncbi:MAG: phage head closure protein [Rhodobacteraceae bacterium]|nr:phage head closure protein [Paracoccaceae bacterium]
MTAPRLNRKLVLENPDRVSDGAGGFVESWVPLGVIWAEVVARTGRETGLSGEAVSAMNYRITTRGAPYGAPDRPKPEQRFREGARVFVIQAVAEDDLDGRYLTCFATEEVAV